MAGRGLSSCQVVLSKEASSAGEVLSRSLPASAQRQLHTATAVVCSSICHSDHSSSSSTRDCPVFTIPHSGRTKLKAPKEVRQKCQDVGLQRLQLAELQQVLRARWKAGGGKTELQMSLTLVRFCRQWVRERGFPLKRKSAEEHTEE